MVEEAEAEVELEVEAVPEPEVEPEPEQIFEPVAEVVEEAEAGVELELEAVSEELVAEVVEEAEPEPEMVFEAEAGAEGLESTAMPTRVCAGCGDSFHPEFMQEIDSKLYCGVCQLRSAALGAREELPKPSAGKWRGTLAALLLLGLLALALLVLVKLGII